MNIDTNDFRIWTGAINAFVFIPTMIWIGISQENIMMKWILLLISIIVFIAEIYLLNINLTSTKCIRYNSMSSRTGD